MGMYDYLRIGVDKLPVSEEEKRIIIAENQEWQTKSLDCSLTEVTITDDGQLQVKEYDLETVPKEERPYPDEEGFLGIIGSQKMVNIRIETLNYTGIINFYTDINENWYEFDAEFIDGKLVSITGGKED